MSPTKRSRDDTADGDAHLLASSDGSPHEQDGGRTKRSRRTRWEENDDDKDAAIPKKPTTPQAKAKLSEIVARLSSVVKEKSTPQQLLQAQNAVLTSSAAGFAHLAAPIDAETAKARALAQASLLSLNLPVTQVSPNDLARRLYIGNLYYELKEEDIRHTFSPFGAIKSIDLSLEPGHGRSKGFCFLEYDDVLAAESAVQLLNGTQLANRMIRVGRPHRGSANPGDTSIGQQAIKDVPTNCVYVGNVRVELNAHHLESIFSPFGIVRSCVMVSVSPLEPGVHRGYGFLEFTEDSAALSAIQHMNGFELAGQNLKVGKASLAAIPLNMLTSSDKVVRDANGDLTSASGLSSSMQMPKKIAAFDEEGVEGVKDVAEPGKEKRCLCLLNLVGKGEVDEELEDEVRGECGRFGAVNSVDVQELDDHVRVFVLFHDEESASKAKQALHGRFFGGNQVQANYYPIDELEAKRYRSAFL
uniref:RRM domain-containing protein n=1 Tax=Globisporangium ultimum (strain ATCC 200006 / CBS 805.95 / DAOM BR144) TaxID=431595 RepID=K3XBN5_GLOUD